jgi:hypothetical protein
MLALLHAHFLTVIGDSAVGRYSVSADSYQTRHFDDLNIPRINTRTGAM